VCYDGCTGEVVSGQVCHDICTGKVVSGQVFHDICTGELVSGQVCYDICTGEVLLQQSRIVRQVMVECPGFATVKFDGPSGLCSAEFGSGGTTVECLPGNGGSYTIFPGSRSNNPACLRIETDGTAIYYPAREDDDTETHYYVMRHSCDVVVETIDAVGYHYIVTRTGDNHVGE